MYCSDLDSYGNSSPSSSNSQMHVSGHTYDLHSMCNFCPTQNHNNVVSQDKRINSIQAASQVHCEVHEQSLSSPLQTGRCSPPKLRQPWENNVVLPSTISSSQNLSDIKQSHLPSYTCASFHSPSITSNPKNNIIFCRSCSPPHDRAELPPHLKVASLRPKTNTSPLLPKLSQSLTSSLTCPDLKSLGCYPSTPSSISPLNCFSSLMPHPNSSSPKSTPCTLVSTPKFAPPKINCLQFLELRSSKNIPIDKNASQSFQVSSRPLSPLPFQPKKEEFLIKTTPLPLQPKEQITKPCDKSHSSANQPLSKVCINPSPPAFQQSSNYDCGSLIPSCFTYSVPETPPSKSFQAPPSTSQKISNNSPAKKIISPKNSPCKTNSPPPLPRQRPCQTSFKPRPSSSCKPSQTSLPPSCGSHIPSPSNCDDVELSNTSTSKPHEQSSSQVNIKSSCEGKTKAIHCSETAKPINPSHPFSCAIKAPPLPSPSEKSSLQLPPPISSYACEHTKVMIVPKNNSNFEHTIPSSMPSCFNFTVPKSLTTCPECSTYCVGSSLGYSQTIEATPRENQSSFTCLPFGPCAPNLRPAMNHSCTQTSSEMQSPGSAKQLHTSLCQQSKPSNIQSPKSCSEQSNPPLQEEKLPFRDIKSLRPCCELSKPSSQPPLQNSINPSKKGCSIEHR